MKRIIILILFFFPVIMNASVKIDDIYYNLDIRNKTAEVTSTPNFFYSGEVRIPETITYEGLLYSVSSIGNSAFSHCYELTSIFIPKSISAIKEWAFEGCKKLTSVHITDIASWCSIKCESTPLLYATLYLNGEEVKQLIIPDGVETIGRAAFACYKRLASVTMPPSVKTIDNHAFDHCDSLTSVTINDGLTDIGNYSFAYCMRLESIIIPNSVTSIGDNAFSNCFCLEFVSLPNSVTYIGEYAFSSCSKLESISLPQHISSIQRSSFSSCYALQSVYIPQGVASIGDIAFTGCFSLTDVYCFAETIPETGRNIFEPIGMTNATLHVLESSLAEYHTTTPWEKFGKIVPLKTSETAIAATISNNILKIYTIDGRASVSPNKGIYILRNSNGKTIKVCK